MKIAFLSTLATLLIVVFLWVFGAHFESSKAGLMSGPYLQRVESVAALVEEYMLDNGRYPIAVTIEDCQRQLDPQHTQGLLFEDLEYFSDGHSYTILLHPDGDGPTPIGGRGVFELRDRKWVTWPEYVPEEYLHAVEERLKNSSIERQPNGRLKQPAKPVTPLALQRGGPGTDPGCARVAPGHAAA